MTEASWVQEITASGLEALGLMSALLQRLRLADPLAGVWEAADVQWWWRKPRATDTVDHVFWVDDEGPVAAVYLTEWAGSWQCEPVVVPGTSGPGLEAVWARALRQAAAYAGGRVEVPVWGHDVALLSLAEAAGFVPGEASSTSWLDAADRPPLVAPADGFVVVDRSQRADSPHPMRSRNGDAVAERLAQGSLYDPSLDLAVETADGQTAGYALFWFDPVTRVGLVEPVRVEDEFQRRGLAGAMLTAGIDRLVSRGAERVKIGYGTDAARAVYEGVGFRTTSTDTWYVAPA
ncbi:N-acetyltransferase [Nocardioides sp.]|uniref:GNAT family N-acetyltransferase n=1 Tax=Nocardioides sp. TaxID=35761 RepID=UPI00271EEA58|nr:GNAT family N-acetyltransferase [Nocardioides sp.]MDO9455970.1 GNAT family N-acetyltransferase [Nocardioides sp.]